MGLKGTKKLEPSLCNELHRSFKTSEIKIHISQQVQEKVP